MNRSEIRHALYRAKNGIMSTDKQYVYDIVEPMIPFNQNWSTFSITWDVFVNNDVITVITPEIDYDFIHTTCLEKSLHEKNNITMELTNRQANVIQIVELNMLRDKMPWDKYNATWGVTVDRELKRIETKLFKTAINIVTDEMIKNSARSDGAAMTELPNIPVVELGEPVAMTDKEIVEFNKKMKKQDKVQSRK